MERSHVRSICLMRAQIPTPQCLLNLSDHLLGSDFWMAVTMLAADRERRGGHSLLRLQAARNQGQEPRDTERGCGADPDCDSAPQQQLSQLAHDFLDNKSNPAGNIQRKDLTPVFRSAGSSVTETKTRLR